MLKTGFIISGSYDPYYNQALEKSLLDLVEPGEMLLYLWRNQHTVFIGRNQNVWKECKLMELTRQGGHLARRISGGGAVYHDLGNLNFTFVTHAENYSIPRQLQVIREALSSLGIETELSGRNDILAQGRKISGNAFYEGKTCFHHGTLLVNTDMEGLGRYLQPSHEKLRSKGVESVRSRVINLCSLQSALTMEGLQESLISALGQVYGSRPQELDRSRIDRAAFEETRQFFAGEQWQLGRLSQGDICWQHRFSWGEVELRFSLEGTIISQVQVFTDSLRVELAQELEQVFLGLELTRDSISRALAAYADGEYRELAAAMIEEEFWLG